MPKNDEHYESKNYEKDFMETVRNIPGRPHDRSRIILQTSGEKYFSTKFHIFCVKYFSSFRNVAGSVLDTVSHQGPILYGNLSEVIKIIIVKINLPIQRNRENKMEKLCLGPDAGGKPSFWFPPERLVKLAVQLVMAYKIEDRYVCENISLLYIFHCRAKTLKQKALGVDNL